MCVICYSLDLQISLEQVQAALSTEQKFCVDFLSGHAPLPGFLLYYGVEDFSFNEKVYLHYRILAPIHHVLN